jgi:exosortase
VLGLAATFWTAATSLLYDWWNQNENGLLFVPAAILLAVRPGVPRSGNPQPILGLALLGGALALRLWAELAVDWFTLRASLVAAGLALLVFWFGSRQILNWWASILLILLAIPLPTPIAAPIHGVLQGFAAQFATTLFTWRDLPVSLANNVIQLPGGFQVIVERGCSGLEAMVTLTGTCVIIGTIQLRSPWLRFALITTAIPVAFLFNILRVFLIGFLAYFVGPQFGHGVPHYSVGWFTFALSTVVMLATVRALEHLARRRLAR